MPIRCGSLTRLESPYPRFDGLNLSWETLEGLAKHNGPVAAAALGAGRGRMPEFDLELGSWPGLEAQVAAIADDIAYDNHDIDDGLRAGLLNLEELVEVPLVADGLGARSTRAIRTVRRSGMRALVRDLIGTMVNDVLAETARRVARRASRSIDEVRAAGRAARRLLGGASRPRSGS